MQSASLGYVLLLGFGFLFFMIAEMVSRRFPIGSVDDFVAAGRSIPFGLVAASVMVSWIWTTTIMGSSEAGMWFGISGGFNYGWGAIIPFFIFIPLVIRLRSIMPRTTTFTEFVRERYGPEVANVFLVFAVGVILYVFMEQAVGVGYAFSTIFGIPYKVGAFVAAMIVTAYIARAGLRGSIFNDLIQFFIVTLVVFVAMPFVLSRLGIDFLYEGLKDAATNPQNPNYNPDALNFFSTAGLRYGFAAIVIAMGQVLFDQGYYSKAISAVNTKSLLWAYLLGTVLAWFPVPVIFGNIMGSGALALKLTPEVTTQISPYIMNYTLGGTGAVLFVLMVMMAGMTTGGNCLAGIQGLVTVDVYERLMKRRDATEEQQVRFGRMVTVIFGVIVGVVAILMEGKSLLAVDIFSGIIFAAPCSAFVAGMFSAKPNKVIALVSTFVGLAGGLGAYFLIENPDLNWFYGNMISLFLPAVLVVVLSPFTKGRFDFAGLKEYEPAHKVKTISG